MAQKKSAGSPKKQMFEFEVGAGGKAKLVCINLAHVSEIVWDAHDENPTLAKLVMASGETYDLTDEEAAAITRRLQNPR